MNWKNSEETVRPVREYLDALDESNGPAFIPKLVSLSDPLATWTARLAALRLRGVSGAQDKFLLAATAQNLRRIAK